MKTAGLILLCALVIAACGAPPAPRLDIPSKAFDKPFDVTWTAVVDALAKSSLVVQDAKRETGLITTGWLKTDNRNCHCGTFSVDNFRMDYQVKLTVTVKKATDTSTEVRVDCRFRLVAVSQSHSKSTSCDSTGRLEQEIYENILGLLR